MILTEQALKLADKLASTYVMTDSGLYQSDDYKKAYRMIRRLARELKKASEK
jgi:hypothetical protein